MSSGDCIRQFVAQIEIPAYTLVIRAAKAEQRFGMGQVDRVFHFAAPGASFGFEVGDFHSQVL